MNQYEQQFNVQLGAQAGAYPSAPPQPTDMQTHIQRTRAVNDRLSETCAFLLSLVGRLYGEGAVGKEDHPAPRPAGLSSELTEALSGTEQLATQLKSLADRLGQFA